MYTAHVRKYMYVPVYQHMYVGRYTYILNLVNLPNVRRSAFYRTLLSKTVMCV
jgi:hypothetical protein